MGWFVVAALLTVSSALNAIQVVAVDDRSDQLTRGGLSALFLFLAALSLRKGFAERSKRDGSPGEAAATAADRQGLFIAGAVVLGIVVVIVSSIASRGPTLSMPERLGGHPRLLDPSFEGLERSMQAEVGGNPVVGFFGSDNQPRFMVAGFDRTLAPGDNLFTEIAYSMDQGLGAQITFDVDAGTTRSVGSVTYTCVPYSIRIDEATSISSTLCDWNDGDSYGLVWSLDPSIDALTLAPVAYDAVVE